jgi:hypothetical protein
MFVVAVVAAGCGSGNKDTVRSARDVRRGHAQEAPPESARTAAVECPTLPSAENTRVKVEEIPEGAALVFTTTTHDVADLRMRVRRMAIIHETVEGMVGATSTEAVDLPNLVRAHATVEDIDGGARLLFVAADATQVDGVRLEAEQHATQVMSGRCATISVRPGGGNARTSPWVAEGSRDPGRVAPAPRRRAD